MLEEAPSRDIIHFFLNQPIFDRMNAEELKVVARHMSIIELAPGDTLFHESDQGNFVCFIVRGELDVIKTAETDGHPAVLARLTVGQSIGEMSIVDDAPRSATAQACTQTLLYTLSKSAFDHILERHAKIGAKMLKGIARLLSTNLRETSRRLADYIPAIT
ncbi:MAG: cyclic nucleotide-binding domain-containing protein [Desulfobacteraceae bacterium]|nr:MAG: cyclic nucleotide-binding domain-containing protein [Desulfobacteraceae bacterium]